MAAMTTKKTEYCKFGLARIHFRRRKMRRFLKHFHDWLDSLLDMHLDFDGDLMTPDWSEGDGDPHYRPERATIKKTRNR